LISIAVFECDSSGRYNPIAEAKIISRKIVAGQP
jgi:hypothetical protein